MPPRTQDSVRDQRIERIESLVAPNQLLEEVPLSEEQAEVVRGLVCAYLERNLIGKDGLPALFVVSPFRSMADGVRKALCDGLKARGHEAKAVSAWGAASVGTG